MGENSVWILRFSLIVEIKHPFEDSSEFERDCMGIEKKWVTIIEGMRESERGQERGNKAI